MEMLCEMYVGMGIMDSYRANGRTEFSMGSLDPETDYYLLLFGWDQAPTTKLTKIPVRTAAAFGDPKDLVLDIRISNLTHKGPTSPSSRRTAPLIITISSRPKRMRQRWLKRVIIRMLPF